MNINHNNNVNKIINHKIIINNNQQKLSFDKFFVFVQLPQLFEKRILK